MDGTGVARGNQEVGRGSRIARVAGATAVLAGTVLIVATLMPPYVRNWQFREAVRDTLAADSTLAMTDDQLRAVVSQKAASLGLPVGTNQVQVARDGPAIRVEVRYSTRVETPVYTVDLHFHPVVSR